SITVLLAAAVLSAVAVNPSPACPPHVAKAKPKLVQRVYSVADLIVLPGSNGGGAPLPYRHQDQIPEQLADFIFIPSLNGGEGEKSGQTLEAHLTKLITETIAPASWEAKGGRGRIDYYPLGMALVITQTADVQEQVADLLDALRRLQDVEVSVEVRLIEVADAFFERIGVDF